MDSRVGILYIIGTIVFHRACSERTLYETHYETQGKKPGKTQWEIYGKKSRLFYNVTCKISSKCSPKRNLHVTGEELRRRFLFAMFLYGVTCKSSSKSGHKQTLHVTYLEWRSTSCFALCPRCNVQKQPQPKSYVQIARYNSPFLWIVSLATAESEPWIQDCGPGPWPKE